MKHPKGKFSTNEFISRAKLAHGDTYDYSIVNYDGYLKKVCIICPVHGEFWQRADLHLSGQGCRNCAIIKNAAARKLRCRLNRPDVSRIKTPTGSIAVPVGTKGHYALVDDEDFEQIMSFNWLLSSDGYALNEQVGSMHRFINKTPDGMDTDHINHNKLDNRKCNLRVCTRLENTWNTRSRKSSTSKYKGVCWAKDRNKWHATIRCRGEVKRLGYYDSEIEAAKAYDFAAKELFKEFANQNFK